jgi:hypothetical protein
VRMRIDRAIIPQGMNGRNLRRCVISIAYLSGVLWILLLAVYSVQHLRRDWRGCARSILFLLLIAFCFSSVAHRGLLRNSIRRAHVAASFATLP